MFRRVLALLLVTTSAWACGSRTSSAPGVSEPSAAPSGVASQSAPSAGPGDLAPVPYPPGTLQASIPRGSVMVQKVEEDGKTPYWLRTEFVATDGTGCTMKVSIEAEDGTAMGEAMQGTATWTELESHAHFPNKNTTIFEETLDTPIGRHATKRYEVTSEKDGEQTLTRMWFASDLPGPPIKMETYRDGKLTMKMVLSESVRPGWNRSESTDPGASIKQRSPERGLATRQGVALPSRSR